MANRCYRCFRSLEGCLCTAIKPFDTRSRIVILMHVLEARREKIATGRLSGLALENSEIITGVDFSNDSRVNELIKDSRYFPCILYPGDNSHNLSESRFGFGDKIPLIFVIDGTWPCAKKMMKLSTNLHSLPRISFQVNKRSRFIIKQQPHESCLSTIESLHVLLSELDRHGIEKMNGNHDHLLDILDKVVQFQIKCAQDPSRPSFRGGVSSDYGREKLNYKKGRGIFYR